MQEEDLFIYNVLQLKTQQLALQLSQHITQTKAVCYENQSIY